MTPYVPEEWSVWSTSVSHAAANLRVTVTATAPGRRHTLRAEDMGVIQAKASGDYTEP